MMWAMAGMGCGWCMLWLMRALASVCCDWCRPWLSLTHAQAFASGLTAEREVGMRKAHWVPLGMWP